MPNLDTHNAPAVFLHGLWRSCTTYIWSRFRASPETYCYYEPLHEGLAHLNPKRIADWTPDQMQAQGHPPIAQPYWAEFGPLLKRHGVKNYCRSFAHDRYILHPDDSHLSLSRYISFLINHAAQQERIPVLGFKRTAFRMGWLTKHFKSWNLHIDRHPFDVWSSYEAMRAKRRNTYFFLHWLVTLDHNSAHPVFGPLVKQLPIRSSLQKLFTKQLHFYNNVIDNLSAETTYFMVFYIWLASCLHALTHSDHVFDIDCVYNDKYCDYQTALIRAGCDLPPFITPKLR
jgi:hypothetical protein